MALQGTIETFALPDVMRLLASTSKTGRLRLTGSRGSGSIWVDGGKVVASEASGAPHADGAVEVVFELLRFKDGDFVFDTDSPPTDTSTPKAVEPVLGEAEAMLEEWKGIEAVVPSLDSWVSLSDTVPGGEVTIDAERWKLIVTVGGGATVGTLGDLLALGEMPISKRVKELKEAGLAEIGDAPGGAVSAPARAATPEAKAPAAPDAEPVLDLSPPTSDFEKFDPDGLVVEDVDADTDASAESLPPPPAPAPAAESTASDPGDAAEIARQLANLSPKAAKAVAAAAKATTQEERELALAEVDEQEDPINRELLIKFLGSVNS